MKTGEYYGTHWYWDADDNEYELCAIWYFEQNYPEMPDSWELKTLEVEEGGELDVTKGSAVWNKVEKDGPPSDLKEADYI